MAITGSCMCGAIKYESSEDQPKVTALCHCTDCQKVISYSSLGHSFNL